MRNIILLLSILSHAYQRSDYGNGWEDFDKDCQNTRQEMLILHTTIPPVFSNNRNCSVIRGQWFDVYTNQTFKTPFLMDVDHIVPFKEADQSGAKFWNISKKIQFANDLNVLLPVNRSTNRAKGNKTPLDWMPPNTDFHCEYIRLWKEIKYNWNLTMTISEFNFISQQTIICLN